MAGDIWISFKTFYSSHFTFFILEAASILFFIMEKRWAVHTCKWKFVKNIGWLKKIVNTFMGAHLGYNFSLLIFTIIVNTFLEFSTGDW